MAVAVKAEGVFERDVAVAQNLDGVVVLSANDDECYVMSTLDNDDLWIAQHPSVKAYHAKTRADGEPWFSFRGVAYVDDPAMITDFKPDALADAEELYRGIVQEEGPVEA